MIKPTTGRCYITSSANEIKIVITHDTTAASKLNPSDSLLRHNLRAVCKVIGHNTMLVWRHFRTHLNGFYRNVAGGRRSLITLGETRTALSSRRCQGCSGFQSAHYIIFPSIVITNGKRFVNRDESGMGPTSAGAGSNQRLTNFGL